MLRQHDRHFTLVWGGIFSGIGSCWFLGLFWLASCCLSYLLGLATRRTFRVYGESFHHRRLYQLADNRARSYHYQIYAPLLGCLDLISNWVAIRCKSHPESWSRLRLMFTCDYSYRKLAEAHQIPSRPGIGQVALPTNLNLRACVSCRADG
jgi:hypothetical protein